MRLPGLYSNSLAPVCKTCIRLIKTSPSFIDYSTSMKNSNRKQQEIKSSISINEEK